MSEQTIHVQSSVEASGPQSSLGSSAAVYAEVTLSVSNGLCFLGRTAFPISKDDFVGLYPNGMITEPEDKRLAWNYSKWAGNYPYATNVAAQPGFVAMYWSYHALESKFVRLAVTPPLTTEIIQNGGTVRARTTC